MVLAILERLINVCRVLVSLLVNYCLLIADSKNGCFKFFAVYVRLFNSNFMFWHELSLWNIIWCSCLGFLALTSSPLRVVLKLLWDSFLVAANSTNLQSDRFPLVTVQHLTGEPAELQVFCCNEAWFSIKMRVQLYFFRQVQSLLSYLPPVTPHATQLQQQVLFWRNADF